MMLKRWRATVRDTHIILHLGDLFFGKKDGYDRFSQEVAPYLTGVRYIILGNHDQRKIDYEELGFTVVKPYSVEYKDFKISFDHYPRLIHDNERRLHIHGHIHGNPYSRGELTRPNNINVSVEVIDYRPQRFTKLVNAAILARKGKEQYYNSRSYRRANTDKRRAA